MGQDEIFSEEEADNWFTRNKSRLIERAPENDPIMRVIELAGITPKRVLEVGAGNGYRLDFISRRYGSKCVAVEPSGLAVEDGRKRYPNIEFRQGIASSLPIGDEKFDLTIVSFVFHWIGRESLFKSVMEIDRTVENSGFLIISDFMPSNPTKVRYGHYDKSEIWTYKQDYAEIFTSSKNYSRIIFISGNVNDYSFGQVEDDYDSFAVSLMQKGTLHKPAKD